MCALRIMRATRGKGLGANIEKLERLARLRDSGALSVTEFEVEKRKLLAIDPAPPGGGHRWAVLIIAAVLAGGGYAAWQLGSTPVPQSASKAAPKMAIPVNPAPVAVPLPDPAPPPPPPNPWVGRYKGTFEGDARGELTIREGSRGRLKFSLGIGASRCTGGLEATLAVLSDTEGVVALPEDESGESCRIALKRNGKTITLGEEGCSYHHGFECSFSGVVQR